MKVADFDFDLPEASIAQTPLVDRGASRLLCMDRHSGVRGERSFLDLVDLLRPGDCLVLNDTQVIKARLFAYKPTGGRVEILVDRARTEMIATAWLRASKPVLVGSRLQLDDIVIEVIERQENRGQPGIYTLRFSLPVREVLQSCGHVPLPPYIRRQDNGEDETRYQTVFAKHPGAVAAPTAGLHFDLQALQRIRSAGVRTEFVTLHVGAGTFQPVRATEVECHELHAEHARVSSEVCERIVQARREGGRVIAVGTTCVRTLETAAAGGELKAFSGNTALYIYPGYRFRVVDAIITNFHLPRSSLLMLVCAFAGIGVVQSAYAHAIQSGYRFYSYGDAMLLLDGLKT